MNLGGSAVVLGRKAWKLSEEKEEGFGFADKEGKGVIL